MTGQNQSGIIARIVEASKSRYRWEMRKDSDEPFLVSRTTFLKSAHAEADARAVIGRARKTVAFVEFG